MNILVTGGAGFVGSNFITHMLETHPMYKIVNYDKLTYAGNLENLADIPRGSDYTFVREDICNAALVESTILKHGIDTIVNFAAESHVDRSIASPGVFAQTNVMGTMTLLEASRRNKISRYIQISTDEVYGALGETGVFTESSPIAPNNPYAASKASADLLVGSYHHTYRLSTSIVRFANTYGPAQYPEKLIPYTITNALQNKPISIHGQGYSVRDWFYVKDNVAAIDAVLHHGKPGEVYNIGARQERRTVDVVKTILATLGKPSRLIKFVDDRPGQDYRYANDPSKALRELPWQPKYIFEKGLQETIDWYVSHRYWWQNQKEVSV